jgi:hypothetical protein
MRIVLDPIPVVLGIYAYVGELLTRAAANRQDDSAGVLAKRMARQRQTADKDAQKLVRALHTDVKTADKLLKKTADVWKISQETDLVDLVIRARGEQPLPRAYVLMLPGDLQPLLLSISEAAKGAGENEDAVLQLNEYAGSLEARPASEYYAFGFDPWKG